MDSWSNSIHLNWVDLRTRHLSWALCLYCQDWMWESCLATHRPRRPGTAPNEQHRVQKLRLKEAIAWFRLERCSSSKVCCSMWLLCPPDPWWVSFCCATWHFKSFCLSHIQEHCHHKHHRPENFLSELFLASLDQTIAGINSKRTNSVIHYRFLAGTWERLGPQITGPKFHGYSCVSKFLTAVAWEHSSRI